MGVPGSAVPLGGSTAICWNPSALPALASAHSSNFVRTIWKSPPGDQHGLDFPISLDMVWEFGPEFLTKAFRSAGTISPDNAVTQIVSIQPLDVPDASENAILTVSYAKAEPGIENDLFIKFPPKDVEFKYSLAHMAHGEVTMLQFARERNLPIRVPYLYFGDYSSLTNNYILITERSFISNTRRRCSPRPSMSLSHGCPTTSLNG